jgi:probable rRNA maturation factor
VSGDPDPGGSSPTVFISNRQATPIDERGLAELARTTLRGEGFESVELSVSLVDDAEIEALHLRYMNEAGPTDVLSFPLAEDDVDEHGVRILGDVVIAPAVAARNAPAHTDGELRLLLVHGILHLLGYDHDDAADRAIMWDRMERYSGVRAP